jgi:hypothetical protein
LLGNRKKIAKFLMRTFTCRSTFHYGWNCTWTALDELVLSDPDGSSWPHTTSVITQGIFNNSVFKVKLEKIMLFLLLTGRYKPLD